MRLLLATLVALAGCFGTVGDRGPMAGFDNGSGSGSGAGGGVPECVQDSQCVAAGARCCDCPSFAVPATDPAHLACGAVACPPSTCDANVRAACRQGACVLECVAMACAATCADGYAVDASGCLTCACAQVSQPECSVPADCARVRADCCGCAGGGSDTAVAQSQAAAFDASLMCPASPACSGVDSCAADLAPDCVQGRCELVAGGLPPGACGRPDLPACPAGQACTVNASDPATMHGVGVCL